MIEKEILGCILQDNSLIDETVLQVKYFSKQEHQLIFQTMLKLAAEGKAIDRVSLLAENYDYLSHFGGTDFIADLESNGKVENFKTYERQLIEEYKKRKIENIVVNFLNSKERDLPKLMEELRETDEIGIREERSAHEILLEMHDLPFVEKNESGVSTGLSDLDKIIGGFQKGNSYILGGRPSMGKSAMMLKFALSAMHNNAVPVIFSLEMSKESLLRRWIATIGNINLFLANNPYELTQRKKEAWQQAVNELSKKQFEIYDQPGQTIEFIRAKTRQAQKEYDNIIVFIDYLTLIKDNREYQSEHLRVGAISKELKNIAREYDVPVVTLAQLSRVVEQRKDKRPMLSDLRESGSIEEDADCVMFLYRDSYYKQDADNDNIEINVAKHRNGPTGTVEVYYNKATGKIGDLSDY
mgnify:FL=1